MADIWKTDLGYVTQEGGIVQAIADAGSGVYYAGGKFCSIGGVAATNIAKWNGSAWEALGVGVGTIDYGVRAIAVASSSEVYVGGSFVTAGGSSAYRLAKWNGSIWSSIGTADSTVAALAVSGTDLYVGGYFTSINGNSSLARLAKRSGTTWSSVGTVNSSVTCLSALGTNIYVGGFFGAINGTTFNKIARWNGTSWVTCGSFDDTVYAIHAVSTSEVYIGGGFSSPSPCIAKWNGSSQVAVGSGVGYTVYGVRYIGTNLYVGGSFATAGGSSAKHIARWDGTRWHPLGAGLDDDVSVVASVNSELHVGGIFRRADNTVMVSGFAKYGTAWSEVAPAHRPGVVDEIYDAGGGVYYVGGTFNHIGTVFANNIAKWNGTSWEALGSGINWNTTTGLYSPTYPIVAGITTLGSTIYVGGYFNLAGGSAASKVAKWDGTQWHPLGNPSIETDGFSSVLSMATLGSDIYVGGTFYWAGGTSGSNEASGFAWWNGSQWKVSGSSFNNCQVLRTIGSYLYVGGKWEAGNNRCLVKWNGSQFSTVANGDFVSSNSQGITDICAAGSDIWVGGDFAYGGPSGSPIYHGGLMRLVGGTTWAVPPGGVAGLPEITDVTCTADSDFSLCNTFFTFSVYDDTFMMFDYYVWYCSSDSGAPEAVDPMQPGTGIQVFYNKNDSAATIASLTSSNAGMFVEPRGTVTNPSSTVVRIAGKNAGDVTDGFGWSSGFTVTTYQQGSTSTNVVDGTIRALGVQGSNLYVGGQYLTLAAGSISISNIAKLQGTIWSALGNGLDNTVNAIKTVNSDVIVGGAFYNVDGSRVNPGLAMWEGPDTTSPTPGNSGTITTASVLSTSLTLNWTKATDNISAQSALQYLAYRSTSSSFDTLEQVTGGTAIGSYAADINTKAVTGLTAGTTYYFNVLVKDEANNVAVYTKKMQATLEIVPPTPGNSGTITTSNVGANAVTLNWTAATDNVDAPSSLQYKVYYSTNPNLSTVQEVKDNGTAFGDYA